jgi:hypothetical protein
MARAFATDVAVTFGPMSMSVKLIAFRPTPESLTSLCPECAAHGVVSPVEQFYECKTDPTHPRMKMGELYKGAKDGVGNIVIVGSSADVASLNEAGGEKTAVLHCHLASQFEAFSYEAGSGSSTVSYALEPSHPTAATMFSILSGIIGPSGRFEGSDGQDRVLVTELCLRGTWKTFMLRTWRGHLILHEVARPADLKLPVEVPDVPAADARFLALAAQLFEAETEPFTAASYPNQGKEHMAAALADRIAAAPAPVTPLARAAAPTNDLMEALAAAVSKAKGGSAAPKAKAVRARKASAPRSA